MKERPILFSGPMVRAILEGRKTQTRRIVKPQPLDVTDAVRDVPGGNMFYAAIARRDVMGVYFTSLGSDQQHEWRCPYGQPGDRLWVRETHCVWRAGNADGTGKHIAYRATEPDSPCGGWTPSIFMPRWASRITLEVKDVRVERLQDISEADAIAEGLYDARGHHLAECPAYSDEPNRKCACGSQTAQEEYHGLWDSINGAGSWSANPWVWVIEFSQHQSEGK